MKVVLPTGGVIQCYGLSGFIPVDDHEPPQWGLYLDEGWANRKLNWGARLVDWRDMELPANEADAFDAFLEARRRVQAGQVIEIACDGGTGRTGTALACLVLADGVKPAAEAIEWVRQHYHHWAVEIDDQERLVERFARYLDA